MTLEAQRTAIAEECQNIHFFQGEQAWCYNDGQHWTPCKNNDPLEDLNAAYVAEKRLTRAFDSCSKYQSILAEVCGCDGYAPEAQFLFHATADQRLEAILRTLGRWV